MMNKRINKGMSIMETAILIALVAVAGIGILTTFGGTVNDVFQKSSIKFKSYEPFGSAKASVTGPGSSGATVNDGIVSSGGTDSTGTGYSGISGEEDSGSAAATDDTVVGFGGLDGINPGTTGYTYPDTGTSDSAVPTDRSVVGTGGSDSSGCTGSNCANGVSR